MIKDFLYKIATDQINHPMLIFVRAPLLLLSWLYAGGVLMILKMYALGLLKKFRLNVPVISVGNLTIGGSGKTPMVIFIAKMLINKKLKPLILTRGYMPAAGQGKIVSDEAQLLRRELPQVPVIEGRDRYATGQNAIAEYQPDVIVLDDGFQHFRLHRDLDIVLIDSVNGFGNGACLPRGILREPISSLKRADLWVMTKTDLGDADAMMDRLKHISLQKPVVETIHRPVALVDIFSGQNQPITRISCPIVAFCAIADPYSFRATLIALGSDIKDFLSWHDHYKYSMQDMILLKNACDDIGVKILVTTQKDAVKLSEFREMFTGYQVYSLNIDIQLIQGQDEFINGINRVLSN